MGLKSARWCFPPATYRSRCFFVATQARCASWIFRAGPSERKRQAVLEVAKREGVEKVFTLVERDEVATWIVWAFKRKRPSQVSTSEAMRILWVHQQKALSVRGLLA